MQTIQTLISTAIDFINNYLVPLVFAVAFITFLYGVSRYLIAGAADPEKRKTGRDIIIYSIIGFAIMISVWGLVNVVRNTFGFDSNSRPCLPTFGKDTNCSNVTGTPSRQQTSGTAPAQNSGSQPSNSTTQPDSKEPMIPGTNLPGIY